MVFHHINAYEEDDHVVFDLISYKDGSMYDMFYIENMRQDTDKFIQYNKSFGSSLCQRFVLPLNVHRVQFRLQHSPEHFLCIICHHV